MSVDSFKFMPRILAEYYRLAAPQAPTPVGTPWSALPRPITESRVALLTSGGLYRRGVDAPFDLEGERQRPQWGDPSFRRLPSNLQPDEVEVAHLHLNPSNLRADFNILFPLSRVQELVAQGEVGALADTAYSFMGYQGFPPDTSAWQTVYAPQVIAQLKQEAVDCVLLTPA